VTQSSRPNVLKPAADRRVHNPATRAPLSQEGEDVGALTPYWHRRLADGDAVFATARAKPSTSTASRK
jgi:hypothetical protein